MASTSRGPVLSFHNVCYDVKPSIWRPARRQHILKAVSGTCRPGEITAIMGSSGSGKSSLIDVLADRKNPKQVKGIILVDGQPRDKGFLLRMGYCEQDDYLAGMLTVRENLRFSAELRLPSSLSRREKHARVEEVIEELQLTKCADSFIGSALVRGISGGERKRVSLGREMVNDPSLILLDEPTTGLDSKMASVVVAILSRWARRGKTIVLSIHQPKYAIFRSFDALLLMHEGEVAYHGRTCKVMGYFERLGYRTEAFNNPADWVLDILNDDDNTLLASSSSSITGSSEGSLSGDDPSDGWGDEEEGGRRGLGTGSSCPPLPTCPAILGSSSGSEGEGGGVGFAELFRASKEYAAIEAELVALEAGCPPSEQPLTESPSEEEPPARQYAVGLWGQVRVLSGRYLLTALRNPMQLFMQLGAMLFFGLLVGGLYHDLDRGPSGIQNRVGAFFLLVMIFTFSNISVLELFLDDRALYLVEKSAGYYRPLAYFIARTSCDIVPMRVVPGVLFCVMTYYLIGLRGGWEHLVAYVAILTMTSLSAASVCLLLSSLVPVFAVANLGVALVYILMMMSSGLLINLQQLPSWLLPLRYVSIFRYALEALSVNEFKGLSFACAAGMGPHCAVPGEVFLRSQQYTASVWGNVAVLGAIFVANMALTFLMLRRLRKG